jgi:hypothetical protein
MLIFGTAKQNLTRRLKKMKKISKDEREANLTRSEAEGQALAKATFVGPSVA